MTLPLPLDVAQDVAEILLVTNRTVAPSAWVERVRQQLFQATLAALPANQI